jgi:hypothetical protein
MKGVDKHNQNSILFPKKGKVKRGLETYVGSRCRNDGKIALYFESSVFSTWLVSERDFSNIIAHAKMQ